MDTFLLGAQFMGYLTAALFFARFHARTREGLFAYLALPVGIMGSNNITLAAIGQDVEYRSGLYVVRLAAFLTILVGVLVKNRE